MITAPTPTMGRSGYSREVDCGGVLSVFMASKSRSLYFHCSERLLQREKRSRLHFNELPFVAISGDSKVQPLISAGDSSARGWFGFHLGVNGQRRLIAIHRC